MTDQEILITITKKVFGDEYNLPGIYFEGFNYFGIIFQHEFAKAFWGEEYQHDTVQEDIDCIESGLPAWQYHLQQMVICEEPLKYLKRFL